MHFRFATLYCYSRKSLGRDIWPQHPTFCPAAHDTRSQNAVSFRFDTGFPEHAVTLVAERECFPSITNRCCKIKCPDSGTQITLLHKHKITSSKYRRIRQQHRQIDITRHRLVSLAACELPPRGRESTALWRFEASGSLFTKINNSPTPTESSSILITCCTCYRRVTQRTLCHRK